MLVARVFMFVAGMSQYVLLCCFFLNALINMEKWIGLLYANVLFY